MLYSAFILGLISSFHCIGMCGPIAVMLPLGQSRNFKKALQIATYHIGRITAYSSFGLLFGLIGRGLNLAGFQQSLSIFAGITMIVIILFPRLFAGAEFSKPIFKIISKVKAALGNQFKNGSFKSLFLIGLMNGFLPCGMVYAALFGAISMGNATHGILYMALFGLGTVPLMTAVVYFKVAVSIQFRNTIQKVIPYAVVGVGILFVLRGLSLGIPYVSPSEVSLFVTEAPACK